MTKTVYALLVGIDAYQPPVPPLRGCIADIERFHTFLEKRITGEGNSYQPLLLRNEKATRQAVIDGIKHLSRAKSGDVALFYYSGHGGHSLLHSTEWGHSSTLSFNDLRGVSPFTDSTKVLSKECYKNYENKKTNNNKLHNISSTLRIGYLC